MPKYDITDSVTGKTVTVEGDTPPTDRDIEEIFASLQPAQAPNAPQAVPEPKQPSAMDLAAEAAAGFNRPIGTVIDVLTSPYWSVQKLMGNPVHSAQELIGQPGAFAGQGTASKIAGTAGEMASTALSFSTAARAAGTAILKEGAQYGESAIRGLLRQLGSATPAEDVGASVASAVGSQTGGEVADTVFGKDYKGLGEAVGSMASPASASFVLNNINYKVNQAIRKAAPTSAELRGAARALYGQLENMGIVLSEQKTANIVKDLENIATNEALTTLRSDSPMASEYRKVLSALSANGEFNGTTYSFLDKARSVFNDIAANKDNPGGRIAGLMRDSIDRALFNIEESDITKVSNIGGNLLPGPDTINQPDVKKAVTSALVNARSLWKRMKAGETLDNAFEDARIRSIGSDGAEYYKTLKSNFRQALLEDPNVFSKAEKAKIETVLEGNNLRKTAEVLASFGMKSEDYVKAMLLGTAASAIAGTSVSQAGAITAGTVAATGTLSAAASALAKNFLKSDANTMRAMVNAGPNAEALTRIYLARKPAFTRFNDQNKAELASLYLATGADLSNLAKSGLTKSNLVSDALFMAQTAREIDQELPDKNKPQ